MRAVGSLEELERSDLIGMTWELKWTVLGGRHELYQREEDVRVTLRFLACIT